jgi:ABC-type transporter Mla MlaB component
MLRITSQIADDKFALKLEGWLTSAWVDELDTCWRAVTNSVGSRRICVDLSDVQYVDEAGRDLLTAMYRAGVRFVTKGCVMPELVREISAAGDLVGRN